MPSLSLLTLNCFGVPMPGTTKRLKLLADIINLEPLSVVCLQEVQSHLYRKQLIDACHHYTFRAFEPFVHAPKGGLLTLSRLPIESADFVLYRERGLWYTPALADWILHKGILVTRLAFDNLPIVVLNTHLTANYTGDWSEGNLYANQEYQQLRQLAEIAQSQAQDALVFVCGDFNIPRGSWLYHHFLEASGLTDPMADNALPTYRPHRSLPTRYATAIDFALYRAPQLPGLQVESCLRFEDRINHQRSSIHLSDHMGIELRLTWGN
jgi:endonuclease/exonuclease/phosphatase family metal-dependent hydrolase